MEDADRRFLERFFGPLVAIPILGMALIGYLQLNGGRLGGLVAVAWLPLTLGGTVTAFCAALIALLSRHWLPALFAAGVSLASLVVLFRVFDIFG